MSRVVSSKKIEKYNRRRNNVCHINCRHFATYLCISSMYGWLHAVVRPRRRKMSSDVVRNFDGRRRAACEWALSQLPYSIADWSNGKSIVTQIE